MRISPETLLSEIALRDCGVLPLLMRMGIYPGFGSKRVMDVAHICRLSPELLATLLDIYVNNLQEEDSPIRYDAEETTSLIDILGATDDWYCRVQLPNISHHFLLLISRSETTPRKSLNALREFFDKVSSEFNLRREFDKATLFPAMRCGKTNRELLSLMIKHDCRLEEEVDDLLSLFVIHLEGGCDPNLYVAVVSAMDALRKDLRQINNLRSRLLR